MSTEKETNYTDKTDMRIFAFNLQKWSDQVDQNDQVRVNLVNLVKLVTWNFWGSCNPYGIALLHFGGTKVQKVQKVHIFIKSCKLNLPEKEERAAFGKRLKRKEAWTAEYRLKQDTAALNDGRSRHLRVYCKIKARIAPCLDFWISRTNVGYFTSTPWSV